MNAQYSFVKNPYRIPIGKQYGAMRSGVYTRSSRGLVPQLMTVQHKVKIPELDCHGLWWFFARFLTFDDFSPDNYLAEWKFRLTQSVFFCLNHFFNALNLITSF